VLSLILIVLKVLMDCYVSEDCNQGRNKTIENHMPSGLAPTKTLLADMGQYGNQWTNANKVCLDS